MKCPICDSLITNEETCLVCQYPHLNKFFVEPVEEIKKYHDDYKRQWKETLNSQAINAITSTASSFTFPSITARAISAEFIYFAAVRLLKLALRDCELIQSFAIFSFSTSSNQSRKF